MVPAGRRSEELVSSATCAVYLKWAATDLKWAAQDLK